MDGAMDVGSIALRPLPGPPAIGGTRRRRAFSSNYVLSRRLDAHDHCDDVADGSSATGNVPSINGTSRGPFKAYRFGHRGLLRDLDRIRDRRPYRRLVAA